MCFPGQFCGRPGAFPIFGLLILAFPLAAHADESERLTARLLADAPPAWKEYRAYVERLQGTEQSTWTANGQIRTSFRLEFKSNPRCKMVLHQSLLSGQTAEDVHAFNPLYGFSLKRKAKNDPWILTDLQIGEFRGSRENWEDFKSLRACISVHLHELPELVQLPNFRVVRASTIRRDGIDLCQFEFESKEASGTLLLDPNRFWVVRHCTIREKAADILVLVRQDVECRDRAANYPIPRRLVLDKEWAGTKNNLPPAHAVVDYDLAEVSRLPDDREFTLTAFGLPEPVGVPTPRKAVAYLWLALAALGTIALAVFLRWMARRSRKV